MIVPQNRLLFWFGATVPALALLAASGALPGGVAGAAVAGLAIIATWDALRGLRNLRDVGAQLPGVVRLSKDREGRFEVRLSNPSRRRRRLRLAVVLPPNFRSPLEEIPLELPEDTEWSRLSWSCTPARRGNYDLDAVQVEAPSPAGFWAVRRSLPVQCELRVYPNLLPDRKSLAALFLNRGAFGTHAQRQLGKGREFEKLREYVPGDGYEEIHWKATARRGKPITKVFQLERTQEVYVVIDASRLSARVPGAGAIGSAGGAEPTLERFVTAALLLGLAAEQQGDLFGLVTFSDQIKRFVRARNGQAHFSLCRDALYTLEPELVAPDFEELATFLRLRLRRRSLLFFLTALDDAVLAESFVRQVDLLRRQHLVLVNMIQPRGVAPVFSNPNVATLEQLYEHLGGHLRWQKLRQLEQVLKRRGVPFAQLQNERLSAGIVTQYLNVKRRQLL